MKISVIDTLYTRTKELQTAGSVIINCLPEEARAPSSPQCSVIIILQFLTKAQIGLHTTIYPVITLAICVEYHNHPVIMAHNQFQSHDT